VEPPSLLDEAPVSVVPSVVPSVVVVPVLSPVESVESIESIESIESWRPPELESLPPTGEPVDDDAGPSPPLDDEVVVVASGRGEPSVSSGHAQIVGFGLSQRKT
jgi:hypothetical protein